MDFLIPRFPTGEIPPRGNEVISREAWDADDIKTFIEIVFAVQGLTSTYRYPLTTEEWSDGGTFTEGMVGNHCVIVGPQKCNIKRLVSWFQFGPRPPRHSCTAACSMVIA